MIFLSFKLRSFVEKDFEPGIDLLFAGVGLAVFVVDVAADWVLTWFGPKRSEKSDDSKLSHVSSGISSWFTSTNSKSSPKT